MYVCMYVYIHILALWTCMASCICMYVCVHTYTGILNMHGILYMYVCMLPHSPRPPLSLDRAAWDYGEAWKRYRLGVLSSVRVICAQCAHVCALLVWKSEYLQALVRLFMVENGFRKYQEAKTFPAANLLFCYEQNSVSNRIKIVCQEVRELLACLI